MAARTACFMLAICMLQSVSALHNHRTIEFTQDKRQEVIANFGFDIGGTADVIVNAAAPGNYLFFFCPSTTYFTKIIMMNADDICSQAASGQLSTLANIVFFNQTLAQKFESDEHETYFLTVETCAPIAVKMEIDVQAVNPNGDLLGYGFVPFVPLFVVSLVVWVLTTAGWGAHLFRFRPYVTKLHLLLLGWPLLRIISSIAGIAEWAPAAASGDPPTGPAFSIASAVSGVWVWIMMLLIAMGFCITHPNLSKENRIYFVVTTVIFLVSFIALIATLHVAAVVIYIIVMFVMIVVLFRRIVVTRRHIRTEITNDPTGGRQVTTASTVWNAPLKARERAMTHFLWLMVSYMVVSVILIILGGAALIGLYWLPAFIAEFVYVVLFVIIGLIFRLRNPGAYMAFDSSPDGPGDVQFNNL